jgi:hypothetical protein
VHVHVSMTTMQGAAQVNACVRPSVHLNRSRQYGPSITRALSLWSQTELAAVVHMIIAHFNFETVYMWTQHPLYDSLPTYKIERRQAEAAPSHRQSKPRDRIHFYLPIL